MLVVRLRQPKHLTPPKSHQRRCRGDPDPAIRHIVQHAHPVDLRPAHRNHRHRPNAPHPKPRRVTSLSGPTVTSLSGVYIVYSRNERLLNGRLWREAALREAQAELARVTRVTTLGELTASIAHEVNQPLAAIGADANACLHWLAADRPDLDSVREALTAIVKDGHRAGEVITRIRTLLARSSVAHEPCDLSGVIQDVLPLVGPEIGRHGILLQTSLA